MQSKAQSQSQLFKNTCIRGDLLLLVIDGVATISARCGYWVFVALGLWRREAHWRASHELQQITVPIGL